MLITLLKLILKNIVKSLEVSVFLHIFVVIMKKIRNQDIFQNHIEYAYEVLDKIPRNVLPDSVRHKYRDELEEIFYTFYYKDYDYNTVAVMAEIILKPFQNKLL